MADCSVSVILPELDGVEHNLLESLWACWSKFQSLYSNRLCREIIRRDYFRSCDDAALNLAAISDSTSEAVWAAYLKRRPDAAPFRNKGWPHFNEVEALLSATASKGTHAFHAALEESCEPSPQPDLNFLNEEGLLQSEPGQKLCEDQNTLLDEDGDDEDLVPWETTPPH
ncbi:hypothetical protein BDR05DRAFT_1006374 [Suillus weaverae]|nr:hypothetical protein BDR05DRAFT_1006374 [Suillus weaverae]